MEKDLTRFTKYAILDLVKMKGGKKKIQALDKKLIICYNENVK